MKPITTDGYWSDYTNAYDVNMSSIYTTLIQYAGRFCEDYASDLLHDIRSFDKYLKDYSEEGESKSFYLGIRALGVDGLTYILSRIDEYPHMDLEDYYRAMFRLTIEKKGNKANAILRRLNGYEMKEALKNMDLNKIETEEIDKEH